MQEYRAYDIILNGVGQLIVIKYKVLEMQDENRNVSRRFIFTGYFEPDDIENYIGSLKSERYCSMNQFKESNINLISCNPLINFKLLLLSKNHKVLEKVYDEVIIDNVCYLNVYLFYINMNNGKTYVINTGLVGVYNDVVIDYLNTFGYKHIKESSLYLYVNELKNVSVLTKTLRIKK